MQALVDEPPTPVPQAPLGGATAPGEPVSCGLQLRSLSTLQAPPAGGGAPSPLDPFTAGRAAPLHARVVRDLAVEGWAVYWTVSSSAASESGDEPSNVAAAGGGSGGGGAAAASPRLVAPGDYIVPPINTFMRIAAGPPSGEAAGGGAALGVDVLIGVAGAALTVSTAQLHGMARLADAAAVWERRNRHGRFRPSGWRTVSQVPGGWAACVGGAADVAPPGGGAPEKAPEPGARLVPTARAGRGAPVTWRQVWHYAANAVLEEERAARARRAGGAGVLTRRDGPARRRYMGLYRRRLERLQWEQAAAQREGEDEQEQRQEEEAAATAEAAAPGSGPASLAASSGASEASLAEAAAAAVAPPPGPERSGDSLGSAGGAPEGTEPAAAAPAEAAAPPALLSREEERELQLLELRLGVADILLARSLAEAAVDRQGASGGRRCDAGLREPNWLPDPQPRAGARPRSHATLPLPILPRRRRPAAQLVRVGRCRAVLLLPQPLLRQRRRRRRPPARDARWRVGRGPRRAPGRAD
jgi:hypothetical protein